jgi:alpha-glucosidase
VWHDGKGETATRKGWPPNNWQSLFGHSAWQWDEKTRQYYYHKFYIQQPDLNWNNPKVHAAFEDIVRFWLERGVGGFRFDAITTLFEDPSLADEGVVLDKNGKPVINAFGDPRTGQLEDRQPAGPARSGAEMRATADKFNANKFPGTRVLIGETYLANIGELEKMYGTPGSRSFSCRWTRR